MRKYFMSEDLELAINLNKGITTGVIKSKRPLEWTTEFEGICSESDDVVQFAFVVDRNSGGDTTALVAYHGELQNVQGYEVLTLTWWDCGMNEREGNKQSVTIDLSEAIVSDPAGEAGTLPPSPPTIS